MIAAGAVLRFATERDAEGFDLQVVGVVLMAVGVVAVLASLLTGRFVGFTRQRHVSSDGRTVVEKESAF